MASDTLTLPENVDDLLARLGNIPGSRVLLSPPPGQATEEDLLKAMARYHRLYELVDGTLVEKAMGFNEAFLGGEILGEIRTFVKRHGLGVTAGADGTVRLLKGLVRMPDVAFVSYDKLPGRVLPREPIPDLAPDLAVEVLSESNTPGEIQRKLKEYFLAGTRLVWIVDPARRNARVYTSPDDPDATIKENGSLDGGDVLPGFSLPLAPLFAHLPPPPKKPRRKKKP
jgi:Uma2 family endonuclease